jgi:hypothetical protein
MWKNFWYNIFIQRKPDLKAELRDVTQSRRGFNVGGYERKL